MQTKFRKLRALIDSSQMEFLMEAHNGLSAKIVEEEGFKGIWASSLTLSASLGVRDNNEASWTQILDLVEFMNDGVSIPILLDGDTGYGNFNTVRRLVRKLEQKEIAGLCIEDKLFPKTNSFVGGEQQPLADIEEFCGKIKAAKDTQRHEAFSVVARTEAFIAGWGLEEALRRAGAYAEAGADAVLVHSRLRYPADLLAFLEKWQKACPVIVVPTAFYDLPTSALEDRGVGMVIWANHMLRSAVTAMQATARRVHREKSIRNMEKKIASVAEVFRLQDVQEYRASEYRYLPRAQQTRAVILAATKGDGFGTLTRNCPKCMLSIGGKTILERQVTVLNDTGIKEIAVVVGYRRKAIALPHLRYIENRDYRQSILVSYLKAMEDLHGPSVLTFGDILYEAHILRDLMEQDGDIVLAVDVSWCQGYKPNREIDAVLGVTPPGDGYLHDRSVPVRRISTEINHAEAHGEWIGLMKLSSQGTALFREELTAFLGESKEEFFRTDINDFLMRLITRGSEIRGFYFRGHWLDIDGPEDLHLPPRAGAEPFGP